MKKIMYFCALIGLISIFSTTANAQNDSIWITDSGGAILTVGHRAHDTIANGSISKSGDFTTICAGSSIQLNINYSKPIHHVQWVTNFGASFSTFTINPTPGVITDYYCHVYEDVAGVGVYRGVVELSVLLQQLPTTYNWVLDGVVNGDTAHYCVGNEVMGYTGSQIGATYQILDYWTDALTGIPVAGTGNPINFPALPAGDYYLRISNALCVVHQY